MKHATLTFLIAVISLGALAQKKALTVDDFIKWKRIESTKISANGKYVQYKLAPEVGNTTMVIHNLETNKVDSTFRAGSSNLAFGGHYAFVTVTTDYEEIRQLKLKKEKKENYPKDSLYLVDLKTFEHRFIDLVKNWKIPETNGDWIAYLKEEALPEPKSDTTDNDTTKVKKDAPAKTEAKAKKKDKDARNLVILKLSDNSKYEFPAVKDYGFSSNGNICYFYTLGDSTIKKGLYFFDTKASKNNLVSNTELEDCKKICVDTNGYQLAFTFTKNPEKEKKKIYSLSYYNIGKNRVETTIDSNLLASGHQVYDDYNIRFTENGKRLLFGVKPKMKEYREDSTTLPEERAKLDIWSHIDGRLQPQQLKEIKVDEKRALTYILDIRTKAITQVDKDPFTSAQIAEKGEGRFALISDASPYYKERSWAYPWARDVYIKDLQKGIETMLFKAFMGSASISPAGKYLYWFNMEEGLWYLKDLKSNKITCLTEENKNDFVQIDDDHPVLPNSYGIGGWYENDQFIFINTKNGFVAFDPTGKRKPSVFGNKKGNDRERIKRKTYSEPFIKKEEGCYVEIFNTKTKEKSLYSIVFEQNEKDFLISNGMPIKPAKYGTPENEYYNYYNVSKNGKTSLWKIESNQIYPNLFVNGKDGFTQLSYANSQQSKYKWYTTELVDYLTADGDSLQGILYKPESFDKSKKYPMIVYFYERMSDGINTYQTPRASYSTISRSFYCSNDYFVFVPDIAYTPGEPGQSALNCIVPGVLNVLNDHEYIDPKRLALQGQSWGGYQTAHLITRCDLFACAMAGAPVSNMTSAYGGIRWGSGYNRAFQYEHGQSRIGGTLWNSTLNYIDNSPLFYADRVNTPLLMMHNDNDGAVPWYQGIEYFTALRRLDKEVWLLVYNGEEHNLTKRPNRVDLSHRMFGFFNYYLKDQEKPQWMKEGIPAIDKGKYNGY